MASLWCTTESYLKFLLLLHCPSPYISPHGYLLPWQPQGTQLTIWRADPCFDRRSIPADTHRHGHMQEHTFWQRSRDPDALWHVHTHVGTHTHKRHLSTLPCHVTAQPRWASLSSAMSTGNDASWLVLLFLSSVLIDCSLSLWKCCAFKFCTCLKFWSFYINRLHKHTHRPWTAFFPPSTYS